jgi:hypothetical protein
MTKNSKNPVPAEQKKLLKVLTCLYKNYILDQTPATVAYLANPTEEGYQLMLNELNAINVLVNNYFEVNGLLTDASENNIASADIWTSSAQGVVQYFSNEDASANTFKNALDNAINIGPINNVGVLKTVQRLNTDDSEDEAYQVFPVVANEGSEVSPVYVNYTLASLVERIGCQGVSNLGFLGFTIRVPIESAPFNTCYVARCSNC